MIHLSLMAIGHLGLIELPLKGRAFTWSNMQQSPLLEQLDWFFTTVNWTTTFPNTLALPLAKKKNFRPHPPQVFYCHLYPKIEHLLF